MGNIDEQIKEEWEKYQEEKAGKLLPNILLLGISGAGKSSLINTIFGLDLAKVSNVKPETRGFTVYEGKKHNTTVNLIDSAGYEMNEGDSFYDSFIHKIRDGIKIDKATEQIHIIWYCVSITNERIEEMDLQLLKRLYSEPALRERVCVVFTKCDEDDEEGTAAAALTKVLKEELGKDIGKKLKCFQVCNDPDIKLELDELLNWSCSVLDDEDLKNAFISAQMADLDMKVKEAERIIWGSTLLAITAVVGSAYSPIPGSDAALLTPLQCTMVFKILDTYNISSISQVPIQLIIEVIITNLGKTLASKIPGGQIVNVLVAAKLTYAFGKTVSFICHKAYEKSVKGEEVDWLNLFDSQAVKEVFEEIQKQMEDNPELVKELRKKAQEILENIKKK